MHQFDRDIAGEPDGTSHFSATLTEDWSINGIPNGGYLMAVLAAAMLHRSDKKSTPIITANFLSRCAPGKARLSVSRISSSHQFERFQASLLQGGAERIRAFGTFADENIDCALDRYESFAPQLSPWAECIPIEERRKYTLYGRLDIRLDPGCTGWMTGRLTDRSEQKGWVRFREERCFDLPAILLMADAFPPPVLASQGAVAWVPTIESSVNVRNLPETAWLKCIFRTRFITCGLLETDGEVWDETGKLVAISRQIAQYRSR